MVGHGIVHCTGICLKPVRVYYRGVQESAGIKARKVAGISEEYVVYLGPFSLMRVECTGLSAGSAPGVHCIQPGRLNNCLNNRNILLMPVNWACAGSYMGV